MKICFFISLLISKVCFAQDIEVAVLPQGDDKSSYIFKLFNNSAKPVAIRASMSFLSFSERDTLKLAIGEWYNGDGRNYYYGVHRSVSDGKSSEPNPYQLLIINPNTYLLTNIRLVDYQKFQDKKLHFTVYYTSEITDEEMILFSRRDKLSLTTVPRALLEKSVPLK